MMTEDEIAAFWKLGATLASMPEEAKDSQEFMQAQALYEQLKAKMVAELEARRDSISEQPHNSMSIQEAFARIGSALNEFYAVSQTCISQATPEEDLKKHEDKWRTLTQALQIVGDALFKKQQDVSLKNPKTRYNDKEE